MLDPIHTAHSREAEIIPPRLASSRGNNSPRRRPRIWELPPLLHAPLLGISVAMDKLAGIAADQGLAGSGGAGDPLGTTLPRLDTRNAVSDAVQRHLEKTHRIWVDRFACVADEAAVLARWRACIEQGEVGGPLWAACTHKRISESGLQRIHADLHTLSCRQDMRQAVDARRMAFLESENDRLRNELCRLRIQHAGDLDSLRQELTSRAKQARPAKPKAEGGRAVSPRSATAGSSAASPCR